MERGESCEVADNLLAALNKIVFRRNLENQLHFPMSSKSMSENISKNAESLHPVFKVPMPLSVDEWGSNDLNNKALPIPHGFHRSILHLIAERCVLNFLSDLDLSTAKVDEK